MLYSRWYNFFLPRTQRRQNVCMLFGGIVLGFLLSVMFSLAVVLHWYYYYAAPAGRTQQIIRSNTASCLSRRTKLIDETFPFNSSDDGDDALACDLLDFGERLRHKMALVQSDMREQVSVRLDLLRETTEHKQQLENMRRHVAQFEFRLRALWISARVNDRERKRFVAAAATAMSSLRSMQSLVQTSNNSSELIGIECTTQTGGEPRTSSGCVPQKCIKKSFNRCSSHPLQMTFTIHVSEACSHNARATVLTNQLRQHVDFVEEQSACIAIVFVCGTEDVVIQPTLSAQTTVTVLLNDAEMYDTNGPIIAFRPMQYHASCSEKSVIILPPPPETTATMDASSTLPMLTPVRRKYLLTYEACALYDGLHDSFRDWLNKLADEKSSDVRLQLDQINNQKRDALQSCLSEEKRLELLTLSTFVLVPVVLPTINTTDDGFVIISSAFTRIVEAQRSGAVPIIIIDNDTTDRIQRLLPLGKSIDWARTAVIVPWSQLSLPPRQLVNMLNFSLNDEEIFRLRLQGRRIYDAYWASAPRYAATLLAALRHELKFFPPAVADWTINDDSVLYRDDGGNNIGNFTQLQFAWDEVVGPIESPYASPQFQFNFSNAIVNSYQAWNERFDVLNLYPHAPSDSAVSWSAHTKFTLPGSALQQHSSHYYRPLGVDEESEGAAAGAEMARDLGGDAPYEQYTIVMLTYKRERVLIDSLWRLHQLPYVNKIIVIWNDIQTPPTANFSWPKLHVPLVVIQAARNTLNNRFLPYAEIETEAVLSIDDDIYMRPDELTLAFRVWRENRDRLVGFPARYQNYHQKMFAEDEWRYNSNYSCEYSMILTGVAFFHKYYLYRYVYDMPQAIRDVVDKWMNCEDIAMNFLIAHENGHKPPLKVTSRWTFKCPGCGMESLWHDAEHFNERSKCINLFTRIYGYNPLRVSQLRADSVLYKTRTPFGKEKCFKFV